MTCRFRTGRRQVVAGQDDLIVDVAVALAERGAAAEAPRRLARG